MRIISQDGLMFDIQYENCHLIVNKKCCEIEAETNNPNFTPVMASYSSVEKCRKAMEMLHRAYIGTIYMQGVELPEGGAEELKEMVKHGFGIISVVKDTGSVKFEPLNICFQFPGDDEIEV